jgi:CBS domain-containing protein
MPAEKKVRDVMIPTEEYTTVSDQATVGEAIEALAGSLLKEKTGKSIGHRSVLVFDAQQRPVGLLTFRGLIRALEPRLLDPEKIPGQTLPWVEDPPSIVWDGFFTQLVHKEAGKKVKEIMRPIKLITVEADAPLMKAVHLMIRHEISSLPVVEQDTVVGIVRINEIFLEVASTVAAGKGDLPGHDIVAQGQ